MYFEITHWKSTLKIIKICLKKRINLRKIIEMKKMRLLCKLKARCSFDYSAIEPHKTQGFIYNQLLGTPFENLHDKKSYKFFCFSNFFK
ncbi:MAG: hypothetical protein QXT97_04435, partial [Candidatus Diapherotrites archaeon]